VPKTSYLEGGYDQALATLRANRHRLDALVEALLVSETLDAADACRAAGVPYPAEPDLPAEAPTSSAASIHRQPAARRPSSHGGRSPSAQPGARRHAVGP
jgi:hypothetical protein